MTQGNALYGSGDSNEQEALGTAFDEFREDMSGFDYSTFQVVVMGSPGGFSVEFTFHLPDSSEPSFRNAEDYEILE